MKRSLIHQSLSLGVQMNEGLLQGWQAEMWLGTIVRWPGCSQGVHGGNISIQTHNSCLLKCGLGITSMDLPMWLMSPTNPSILLAPVFHYVFSIENLSCIGHR